jgi:hypothetical protein
MRKDLIDDGENQAVRSFLSLYGGGLAATALGKFAANMESLGWDDHPTFVKDNPNDILTKAGAQLWIRHLFALEVTK